MSRNGPFIYGKTHLLKHKKNNTMHKMNVQIFLGVFSMFILIHPDTYFIRIAPPLNCGGTPTMMITPQCQIVHVFTPTM